MCTMTPCCTAQNIKGSEENTILFHVSTKYSYSSKTYFISVSNHHAFRYIYTKDIEPSWLHQNKPLSARQSVINICFRRNLMNFEILVISNSSVDMLLKLNPCSVGGQRERM
jgi:archaellum biogenesis ATPase FlaH